MWRAGPPLVIVIDGDAPLIPPDSYQVLCHQIPGDNMGTSSPALVPSVERTWVDTVTPRAYRTYGCRRSHPNSMDRSPSAAVAPPDRLTYRPQRSHKSWHPCRVDCQPGLCPRRRPGLAPLGAGQDRVHSFWRRQGRLNPSPTSGLLPESLGPITIRSTPPPRPTGSAGADVCPSSAPALRVTPLPRTGLTDVGVATSATYGSPDQR